MAYRREEIIILLETVKDEFVLEKIEKDMENISSSSESESDSAEFFDYYTDNYHKEKCV